ncbi:ethylene-overproduction protein 1-like isoform X2 [Impatiens glandulifera]|uniref:ethylene-overproduction protein 1-like isoform X2 n=1 Tax=Impatiens glandulifera TaxID=253017 RepID=UPI001FB05098|nr:ethylene-overproduction protein 1-like isoform X2 [Impatiens glandulifera]
MTSVQTQNGEQSKPSRSKLADLVRQYVLAMRHAKLNGLKLIDRWKTNQVHALNPPETSAVGDGGKRTISSLLSIPNDSVSLPEAVDHLLLYDLPTTDLLEPQIDPFLKPVDCVDDLADVHRRLEICSASEKSSMYMEKYSLLRGLGDPKLLRRCLQAARQNAGDVHSKVVLSAWLRHERREDELSGISSMNCIGRILECPKAALINGYDQNSVLDRCLCYTTDDLDKGEVEISLNTEKPFMNEGKIITFYIENEEIYCDREKMARLSTPLKTMLYGEFAESKRKKIDFSGVGISKMGMRAVEIFSRTSRLDPSVSPNLVLELLSFSNRFCCEELKTACDNYLASIVSNKDEALILIDYGLEEAASLLVASCLLVLLRELPGTLYCPKAQEIFCELETGNRLSMAGHSSFLLYYFLSQVAIEENITWDITLMLTKCMKECAREKWQRKLAFHQLGCVFLERNEYNDAELCFIAAAELGHAYSVAGIARTKHKRKQRFSAYKLIDSLISENKAVVGWMYQERSLYNVDFKRILDLKTASDLDPTLPFPYQFRAVTFLEENQIESAISELNKIIGFKVSPINLELRAWCYIALKDYKSAIRDIRALLMLDPDYVMLNGNIKGCNFIDRLSQHVQSWGLGECWMQLYDRWSAVDDIGSLAVIHQMLENCNANGKSFLWFRQSLLLLRLNCQKAAMRSLRLAQNHAASDHERLVHEGWILYDMGNRDEALSKAELSISIQRSFEAFFLKAYVLADAVLDQEGSSLVIGLLEEALRCPSDGLRKGQALNNLGSIYVDCGKLDLAGECYSKALEIKHTRAHQGLARVYHLKHERKVAYEEMTKLIDKAENNASAYEKRSEYCERELASSDLSMATLLDPLRTYPYRYRAAVLMDEQREMEAVEELTKAIAFKPDMQMLYLRAAFYESMGELSLSIRDCEAALCLDPTHKDTVDMYNRMRIQSQS